MVTVCPDGQLAVDVIDWPGFTVDGSQLLIESLPPQQKTCT